MVKIDFAGWVRKRIPTTGSWWPIPLPRDGRFIEEIGTYDPLADGESKLKVDLERAKHWVANGAQPTDTVRALLKKAEA
jgi:ribosomal protein S16